MKCPYCGLQTYEANGVLNACVHFSHFRKQIQERGHLPPDTVIEAIYEAKPLSKARPATNHRN